MIYLRADGRKAHITKDLPITTGSVGMKVDVSLSEDYDGLASVVTFKAGTVTADVAYVGELVEVPPQVMQRPNTALLIGVYAQSADGRTVIPTVWDSAGIIQPGTLPVDFPQPDPAPSWAAQVQLWAEDAHNTAERLAAEVDGWEAGENERIAAESARAAAETSRARAEATRYSNESTRVTNEASRVLAEQDRQRAEGERESAESSRVSAETARAVAEAARASAETARSSAESQRASAEAARKTAESGRASAESSRQTAESGRVSAEQARVSAEQARSLAEQARDESESAREDAESDRETEWATLRASAISATSAASDAASSASEIDAAVRSAEQARVAAESSRAAAEAARETAESARQDAESSRASAESARALAETQRSAAESQRASAEQGRATAESGRASAESQRVDAEDLRVAAEDEREQAWNELSQEAQEAIDAATEAAESVSDDVDALYNGSLQLFGNQLMGTLSGTIATAADAYAAPPMALSVDGASTQAGTPTPDAPVPILSVDDLSLVLAGKNMLDAPRNEDITTYGMTWHFESDGTFHAVSGTANSTRTVVLATLDEVHWPAGDYYLTFDVSKTAGGAETKGPDLSLVASDGTIRTIRENYSTKQEQPIEFTLAEGERPYTINFAQTSGTSYSPSTIYRPRVWPAASGDSGYEPYIGTTVPLLPEGTSLRSLPDGTSDTLNLSYLRPSTREGWAWYSRELVQRVYELEVDPTWSFSQSAAGGSSDRFTLSRTSKWPECRANVGLFNRFQYSDLNSKVWGYASIRNTNWLVFNNGDNHFSDVTAFKAWLTENPVTVTYPLTTPVTTTLDPIELPTFPAPNCTVWCDGGSATPSYMMQYVQDTNIVIAELRAALADLATS